jgi:hypothetical protein
MNQADAANVASYLTHMTDQGLGSQESRESLLRVAAHLNAQIARMNQPLFNPSAFPVDYVPGLMNGEPGMSLRDYFAAKAAPALLRLCQQDAHEGQDYLIYCAGLSYKMADAMLQERDK